MALTVSNTVPTVFGTQKVWQGTVGFDDSYPTGGEVFTPAGVGFVAFDRVDVAPKNGYVFQFDYTNNKILAYYGDYSESSDGPLVQVANTADLSGVTGVELTVYGR
jgi:hypothetical protein